MRDIKFRAWSDFEELMSYDVTVYANGWYKAVFPNGYEAKYTPNSGLKVMQYTGLKDKNGKEIYENDVCRDGEALYVVRYSDELGQWLLHLLENGTIMNNVRYLNSDVVTEMEINGNIYENPSLLEQS